VNGVEKVDLKWNSVIELRSASTSLNRSLDSLPFSLSSSQTPFSPESKTGWKLIRIWIWVQVRTLIAGPTSLVCIYCRARFLRSFLNY